MSVSLYLDSQRIAIRTTATLQNSIKEQNPDYVNNFDFVSQDVSIFSSQIKREMGYRSTRCNNMSSEIVFQNKKEGDPVKNSISDINSQVMELQALLAWAGETAKDLTDIPGLDNSTISSINKNMNDAVQFGALVVSKSASQASEAIGKIKTTDENEHVVKETKNNIEKIQSGTPEVKPDIEKDTGIADITPVDNNPPATTGITSGTSPGGTGK